MANYLAVGHVTVDVTDGVRTPGGSVLYAAREAVALDYGARVVTAARETDIDCLADYDVHLVPSTETTTFRHRWANSDRELSLISVATPLTKLDVPAHWRSSEIWHLAPVAGEISESILDVVPPEAFVGVTPQGWMRGIGLDGRVVKRPWPRSEQILARANAMVLSEEDTEEAVKLAQAMADMGKTGVVTCGPQGALLFFEGVREVVPAFRVDAQSENGAGDVFATAFFIELASGAPPREAADFASAAAAAKVRSSDPRHAPQREEVMDTQRGSRRVSSPPPFKSFSAV